MSLENRIPIQLKEAEQFSHITALVTGGASGIGRDVTRMLHWHGANVVIGSRSDESYEAMRSEFLGRRISHFGADISRLESVEFHINDLVEKGIFEKGKKPNLVVHSVSGGMESVFEKHKLKIARLRRVNDPKAREEKMIELRELLMEEVTNSMDFARKTNVEGGRFFTEKITELMPEGSMFVVYPSLWSWMAKKGALIPGVYSGIAETKNEYERWLMEYSSGLSKRGINVAFIIPHIVGGASVDGEVVNGTGVGKGMIIFMEYILSEEDAGMLKGMSVTTRHVAEATKLVIESNPNEWDRNPAQFYVLGDEKGGAYMTNYISPKDVSLQIKFPL
ncbi:MAG: SDR family NAD(P)-dependent oxidoreductase [Candidatus Levybacteria bacterium]|nr:SDR family NAD(P)-dependent oxidoreductase [Candidatus Levybacteria bacterium]